MNMNISDIFAKVNSGELKMHSELGTRDERRQTRNFGARIAKMKTVTGINHRALVMKDLVIPFNPMTGEADDAYNERTPFRPILLVSQAIQLIKTACAENAELAAKWEVILGGSLDLSDIDTATQGEYLLFKHAGFIKPRIMSYSTITGNFNEAAGLPKFACRYTVDPTQLNEEGSYDYDKAPIWHKAAIFFNTILNAEAKDKVSTLEQNGANKETIANTRRSIYSKAPVGFVRPTNLVPFVFIPLDEAPPQLKEDDKAGVEQILRYYSMVDKFQAPIVEIMQKDEMDELIDYYDLTIKTPTSKDTNSSGKVYTDEDAIGIYQAMTIQITDGRKSLATAKFTDPKTNKTALWSEHFAATRTALEHYFYNSQLESTKDGGETFEKIMARSNRFRPIDTIMDRFLPACNEIFVSQFANSNYFSEEVKKANSEFFTAMNPDNAFLLADADDDELEEASASMQASIGDIMAEVNQSVEPVEATEMNLGADLDDDEGDLPVG